MKTNIKLIMAFAIAMSVVFTSCKKTDAVDNTDNSTELSTHSEDQARVSGDVDDVADDVNGIIDEYSAFTGSRTYNTDNPSDVICNGTAVMDSTSTDRRITITYNGANCIGNRIRQGIVIVTMPLTSRWRDAGAVLTVTTQSLRITRVRDNKSITISGTQTYTNVSGGLLRNLATLGSITHDINSTGITVTFDNNSQRSWQVARRRVFSYNNGIVITVTGTHTDGTITGISEWGTNRFGNNFVTSITQPMVVRQDCNFRLVSGEVKHQRLAANIVTTFGLDSAGIPTGCPGNGTYYFKTVWTGINGVVRTVILPY
jgi:hypothetical protein